MPHLTNETIGELVGAVVGLVAAIGLSVGLIVEFGGSRRLHSRWRRFIGLGEGDNGPARPRIWAVATGFALLFVVEATVCSRLVLAVARSDFLGAAALSLHLVALVGWLVYAQLNRTDVSESGASTRR